MSQQDQQHVTESVRYLWSSNDSERRAGIELILQIGPPAEDLLLKSLIELTRDQYPRFPKEIEEEGKRAVEEYRLNGNLKRMIVQSTTKWFLLRRTPSRSWQLTQE